MAKIILFNKPFDVLSQFTDQSQRQTLASYIHEKDFYPAGRLDRDSEGLLLLTNSGKLQHQISDPSHKMVKIYWAQIEGEVNALAIDQLRAGITLKDGLCRAVTVKQIDEPLLWQRDPPIRQRKHIPTSWLEIALQEGKNRQVRRMTAAVGYPTLRLVRKKIGSWELRDLQPGEWVKLSV